MSLGENCQQRPYHPVHVEDQESLLSKPLLAARLVNGVLAWLIDASLAVFDTQQTAVPSDH